MLPSAAIAKNDPPVLTSVTAAYLQRNLRPKVASITVHPPGIVFQKPYSTGDPDLAGFDNQTTPDRKLVQAAQNQSGSQSLGRRTYQKGLQTIVWRAEDENDDDLSYDVWYRREGDVGWNALRRNIPDTILVWDTATVPNGTYFIKIVASDSPSNPTSTALSGELESIAFEIDNTPPQITVTSTRVVPVPAVGLAQHERDRVAVRADDARLEDAQRALALDRDPGLGELLDDAPLLQHARTVAPRLLDEHPDAARAHVDRWLGGKAEYFKA